MKRPSAYRTVVSVWLWLNLFKVQIGRRMDYTRIPNNVWTIVRVCSVIILLSMSICRIRDRTKWRWFHKKLFAIVYVEKCPINFHSSTKNFSSSSLIKTKVFIYFINYIPHSCVRKFLFGLYLSFSSHLLSQVYKTC